MFEVKLTALRATGRAPDATLGAVATDKRFHGGPEATGVGEMLTAATAVSGCAGRVAIERVSGTPDGRSGTFVPQLSGTMTRGAPELTITALSDSATGALTGLAGTAVVDMAEGRHSYASGYTLPAAR